MRLANGGVLLTTKVHARDGGNVDATAGRTAAKDARCPTPRLGRGLPGARRWRRREQRARHRGDTARRPCCTSADHTSTFIAAHRGRRRRCPQQREVVRRPRSRKSALDGLLPAAAHTAQAAGATRRRTPASGAGETILDLAFAASTYDALWRKYCPVACLKSAHGAS